MAKIQKNTLLSGALVRIRLDIEKNTLFGKAFLRVRAKIMITPLWQGFGYGKGKIRGIHPFW